jgi:hypothetical protein
VLAAEDDLPRRIVADVYGGQPDEIPVGMSVYLGHKPDDGAGDDQRAHLWAIGHVI